MPHEPASASAADTMADPRRLEAELLLRAAGRLQAVVDGATEDQREIISAIRYNRKIWGLLLGTVSRPENPLPRTIRQHIACIASFVIERSIALEFEPRSNLVTVLVRINREVAAGLHATPKP